MAKDKKMDRVKKSFFKDFKLELKKVTWPTGKELFNSTTAVLSIVLIVALIVFVLDLGFDFINTQGINRLKKSESETTQVEEIASPEISTSAEQESPEVSTTPEVSAEAETTTEPVTSQVEESSNQTVEGE
jgi:preprotein translocase subunit SecE